MCPKIYRNFCIIKINIKKLAKEACGESLHNWCIDTHIVSVRCWVRENRQHAGQSIKQVTLRVSGQKWVSE